MMPAECSIGIGWSPEYSSCSTYSLDSVNWRAVTYIRFAINECSPVFWHIHPSGIAWILPYRDGLHPKCFKRTSKCVNGNK